MAGAASNQPGKQHRVYPPQPSSSAPIVVDPRWIISALLGVLLFGLACAYATLCVVFYYSQWQLVLHPSHDLPDTPASLGLAFSEVHFAVDASGQPQIDGWWIPSQTPADPTALLLHDGSGAMSSAVPDAELLHNAHLNVLLFDYRGFGRSRGQHPTQGSMEADARSAFDYLTNTRRLPPSSVLVYGRGLGGSLAALLCAEHPAIPALILYAPNGDLQTRVVSEDSRARMVPVSLLFHERFPLADRLSTLRTPKLLISPSRANAPLDLQRAADPKITAEIPAANSAELATTLRRFLDSYVPRPPAELKPRP